MNLWHNKIKQLFLPRLYFLRIKILSRGYGKAQAIKIVAKSRHAL